MYRFIIGAIVLIICIVIWYVNSYEQFTPYIGTFIDTGKMDPLVLDGEMVGRVQSFDEAVKLARRTDRKYMALQLVGGGFGGRVLVSDNIYDKKSGSTVTDVKGHKWGEPLSNAVYCIK